jgi:adenine-specific DNA methylase
VGWSKTYLQLTHITCLTKHKPKGKMKKKQKKKSKNKFCREEKKTKQWSDFFFFHQMKYAKSMMRKIADY